MNAGFGRLFANRKAAEQALGGECFPAPLGDVVKRGPDGTDKHRLIQDLRRNGLSACVSLPERQVLPRFVDHAVDVAVASAAGDVEVLILDFSNAFMSIPANAGEARFNCCLVESAIRRDRAPLDDDEPLQGTFVVWRVLGFGGSAYPLLYARGTLLAASRAPQSRT